MSFNVLMHILSNLRVISRQIIKSHSYYGREMLCSYPLFKKKKVIFTHTSVYNNNKKNQSNLRCSSLETQIYPFNCGRASPQELNTLKRFMKWQLCWEYVLCHLILFLDSDMVSKAKSIFITGAFTAQGLNKDAIPHRSCVGFCNSKVKKLKAQAHNRLIIAAAVWQDINLWWFYLISIEMCWTKSFGNTWAQHTGLYQATGSVTLTLLRGC